MTKRNPKQEGSNVFDCKPQSGPCPLNCNQCFYNREGAFYVDIHRPHMPSVAEVGDGIVRVNCGHDSNIDREKVIAETAIYKDRFFNTAIAKFDFPAPVVFTANRKEEQRATLIPCPAPDSLMFVRLRVSSTNSLYIKEAVLWYAVVLQVPVVLTFMAYYDGDPPTKDEYKWKVRHINSYWCARQSFIATVLADMKQFGGRMVTICGTPDSNWCRDCRNCETYYWQAMKRLCESNAV